MRPSTLAAAALALVALALVALALVALAPVPSLAAWPTGGLQVAIPYHYNGDGKLIHDGAGNILTLVHNSGHSNWWVANRITPDGDYAAGWNADGLGFGNDGTSPNVLAVASDGSGGLWHAQHLTVTSSTDVLLNHATSGAINEPVSYPGVWSVAATSANEVYPAVERDAGTGAFVAWWRNFTQLYLQRVTSSGAVEVGWLAAGKVVLSDVQNAPTRPGLLADGEGGVLVLANGYTGVRLMRVDASGNTPAGWSVSGLLLDPGGATSVDLVRSDAAHVFAVWTVGDRVVSQRVPTGGSGALGWPGSPVELFAAAQGAWGLDLVADGTGGLHALCRTSDEGARWQHVSASGALAPGFAAGGISPLDADAVLEPIAWGPGARLFGATGNAGGLIACWHDLRAVGAGARARWLSANGTPDPAEPSAGRLIVPEGESYAAPVRAALDDGDGGAFLLWSAHASLPLSSTAYVVRAYKSSVLGVDPPLGTLALAVSPNPSRDHLTVHLSLPLASTARLSVHDVAGRLISSRTITGAGAHVEHLDDVGALAPGVYVVTLAQGSDTRRVRLAVIR